MLISESDSAPPNTKHKTYFHQNLTKVWPNFEVSSTKRETLIVGGTGACGRLAFSPGGGFGCLGGGFGGLGGGNHNYY